MARKFRQFNWHDFPKDRSLLERIARKIVIPPGKKKSYSLASLTGSSPNRFSSYEYRESKYKRLYPFRYWLSNDLPDMLDSARRRFLDALWWVKYRTTHRNHIIKLDVKPGYLDSDSKILYSCFQILVDFVEIELAHRNYDFLGKWINHRCPEAGIDYLDWEINHTSGHQSESAKVKKELYLWWTVERPARVEPFGDPLIWQEWRADKSNYAGGPFRTGEPHERARALEEFYSKEDSYNLHRLMDVRSSLWT